MVVKKKYKPKRFTVMNLGFRKQVKARWRRPRGVDNKKRIRAAFTGPSPRVGYKNSAAVRFMHPMGMKEVLVHNVAELAAAGKDVVVRIAGGVGKKKRLEIEKKAAELKLHVLNAVKKEGAKEKAPKEKKAKPVQDSKTVSGSAKPAKKKGEA